MLLLLELGLPVPAGLHCTALGVVDDCLLYSTADFFLVWRPVTQSAGLGMCMSWSCRGAAPQGIKALLLLLNLSAHLCIAETP